MSPQSDRYSNAQTEAFNPVIPVEGLSLLLPSLGTPPDANDALAADEVLERNEIKLNLRHWGINE